MSDPFVGEMRMFGFNFPPKSWAFCDGQLLPLSQNTALFSLLGTFYGGDGKSTFALPNFQGRAPMQPGQGPGLSLHDLGESGGSETVTLLTSEMPVHTHTARTATSNALTPNPVGKNWANEAQQRPHSAGTPNTAMNPLAINLAGGSLPHNNMPPYLILNFCICLQGVFPPRS